MTGEAGPFDRVRDWHHSLGLRDLMVGDDEATATTAEGTVIRLDLGEDVLVLAATVEDAAAAANAAELTRVVGLARHGLTDVDVDGTDAIVRARVYLDGLSKHAFASALEEVAKGARQLRDALDDARERAQLLEEIEDRQDEETAAAATAAPVPSPAPAPPRPAPPAPAIPPAPAVPALPTAPAAPGAPAWSPTHLVPAGGTRFWTAPDGRLQPAGMLAAGTPVRVAQTTGAWALAVASNGWQGWVDARSLAPAR